MSKRIEGAGMQGEYHTPWPSRQGSQDVEKVRQFCEG
jgi:hypothetical protein